MYGQADYKVYDPFMGSGTTAIACETWGSNEMVCIGSELSEQQVQFSKDRLNKYREEHKVVTQ